MKISTAIEEIIYGNPFLQFGISHRLYNLSEMAKLIKPIVEIRAGKKVQQTALVMALSRLQRNVQENIPQTEEFEIENLSIQANLATRTYEKSTKNHKNISQAYHAVQKQKEYFVYSESTSEITIFFHKRFIPTVDEMIRDAPKYKNNGVTSVRIKFDERFFHEPGLMYLIMQKMMLQKINIIDMSSTFTELIFFINKDDLQLVFDTIRSCFEITELR